MSTVLKDPLENQPDTNKAELTDCLQRQREAYLAAPNPDFAQRKSDLLALKRLVSDNSDALVDAINKDYGNRSRHETFMAEIILVLDGIQFAIKHLRRWMKTQRREIDFTLHPGARNRGEWSASLFHGISRCNWASCH